MNKKRSTLTLMASAGAVAIGSTAVALAVQSTPTGLHGRQAAAAGRTDGSTVSDTSGPAPFHLQDNSNGMHLAVMLDATSPNYGIVDVTIPGVGLLETTAPVDLAQHSNTSTTLTYDGSAALDPSATDTEFGIETNAAHRPNLTATTVRLIGQLDPAHNSGQLDLWMGKSKYHLLRSNAPVTGAERTVASVRLDLLNGNLDALYTLLDPSAKRAVGHDEFVTRMRQGLGATAATTVTYGTISYSTSAAGVDYANVPITIVAGPTNTRTTGTLQLIRVAGSWQVLQIKPAS